MGSGAAGTGCGAGSDCASTICGANGICCASACPDQGATSCGTNGTCATGTGVCQDYPAGTVCTTAGCTNGVEATAGTCNGAGACGGTTTACAPYACGATACKTSCAGDADCAAADYCSGTTCVAKVANGGACTAGDQCAGGSCVGGMCTASCGSSADCSTGFCWDQTCTSVAAITAGGSFTCALTTSGAVQCWGYDFFGELDNGSTGTSSNRPVYAGGLSGIKAISSGLLHSCAITSAGCVECWGENEYGQLGNNTTTSSDYPVAPTGLACSAVAISAGQFHTCAVMSGGTVECWGQNTYGQLGDGSTTKRLEPVPVTGISSGATGISAGGNHTCAVVAGAVECWGDNATGQLGNASQVNSSQPVPVSGLSSGVTAVSSGMSHACALTTAGAAVCWGDDSAGQLGNGMSGATSDVPVAVTGLSSGVTGIYAGEYHTCALAAGGVAQCWGENMNGQLGQGVAGNATDAPAAVQMLSPPASAMAAGQYHTCALTAGRVQCWGMGGNGQLGAGSYNDSYAPVAVAEP